MIIFGQLRVYWEERDHWTPLCFEGLLRDRGQLRPFAGDSGPNLRPLLGVTRSGH